MSLLYSTILPTYATALLARTLEPVPLNTCTTSPILNLVATGVLAETVGRGKEDGGRGRGDTGSWTWVGRWGTRDSGTWKGKLRRNTEPSKGKGGRGKARSAKVGEGREREREKEGVGGEVGRCSIL